MEDLAARIARRGAAEVGDGATPTEGRGPSAPGFWRDHPGAAPEAVRVRLGAATVIVFGAEGAPLAHWPLGALAAVSGDRALTIAPDDGAGQERLGVDDPALVAALRAALNAATAAPRRRRARRLSRIAALVLVVGAVAAGLWRGAPMAVDALAAGTPPAARAAVGAAAVAAAAGAARCHPGPAAARLSQALTAAAAYDVRVALTRRVDAPLARAAPGGWLLLNAPVLAASPPDAARARVAAAVAVAQARPPLAAAMRRVARDGAAALARLRLPKARLTDAAAALAAAETGPEDDAEAPALAAALVVSDDVWSALADDCAPRP